MGRRARLGVVACLLLACGGDKSGGDKPRPERKAPEPKPLPIVWEGGEMKIPDAGRCVAHAKGTKVWVSLELLSGSSFEVGGQTRKLENTTSGFLEIDVRDKLGGLSLDALEAVDTGLVLKIWIRDGRQGETKIPPLDFKRAVADAFDDVVKGPVLFGAEPADPAPEDALVFAAFGELDVIGKRGLVSEIDLVATVTRPSKVVGTKVCAGYTGHANKSMPNLKLMLEETEVVVWNRRTGAVVDKKVFPPDQECPKLAFKEGGDDTQHSATPSGAIQTWLKAKMKVK